MKPPTASEDGRARPAARPVLRGPPEADTGVPRAYVVYDMGYSCIRVMEMKMEPTTIFRYLGFGAEGQGDLVSGSIMGINRMAMTYLLSPHDPPSSKYLGARLQGF